MIMFIVEASTCLNMRSHIKQFQLIKQLKRSHFKIVILMVILKAFQFYNEKSEKEGVACNTHSERRNSFRKSKYDPYLWRVIETHRFQQNKTFFIRVQSKLYLKNTI